jgi:uncharacterized protein YndB with AHSA1/START domain
MVGHIAVVETEIDALPGEVWIAMTDPELIKKYMFGSQVVTHWVQGSPAGAVHDGCPHRDLPRAFSELELVDRERRREVAIGIDLREEFVGLLLDSRDRVGACNPAQRGLLLSDDGD